MLIIGKGSVRPKHQWVRSKGKLKKMAYPVALTDAP